MVNQSPFQQSHEMQALPSAEHLIFTSSTSLDDRRTEPILADSHTEFKTLHSPTLTLPSRRGVITARVKGLLAMKLVHSTRTSSAWAHTIVDHPVRPVEQGQLPLRLTVFFLRDGSTCSYYCRQAAQADGFYFENAQAILDNVRVQFGNSSSASGRLPWFGVCLNYDNRSSILSNNLQCIN
eukprot:m.172693 g.172693  ORF g.172693 m.172693 type:complete len:181 (+) comp16520_c0_seq6:1009-1551(+)